VSAIDKSIGAPVAGAEFVISALQAEGVHDVFMVPGGHNDPFMAPMARTSGLATLVSGFEGGAA